MARLHNRGQDLCGASVPPNKEGWEECQSYFGLKDMILRGNVCHHSVFQSAGNCPGIMRNQDLLDFN